jgi:hypothetical protein
MFKNIYLVLTLCKLIFVLHKDAVFHLLFLCQKLYTFLLSCTSNEDALPSK